MSRNTGGPGCLTEPSLMSDDTADVIVSSETPLLTRASLVNISSRNFGNVGEDIARAAITMSAPLFGLDDVAVAVANALVESALNLEGNTSVSITCSNLLEALFDATQRARKMLIGDAVFRELSKVCVRMKSVIAARCSVAVACRLWDPALAEGRLRVLLYDIVFAWGVDDPLQCVTVVERMRAEFAGVGGVLLAGRTGGAEMSALQKSLLCTLRGLVSRVQSDANSGHLSEGSGMGAAAAAESLCEYLALDSSAEKSLQETLRAHLSMEPENGDIGFCTRLALSLESRRRKPTFVYEEFLAKMVWPAISNATVVYDPVVTKVCFREADGAKLALPQAIMAAGTVLAAISWNSDTFEARQGCLLAKDRLLSLLDCAELPLSARVAAGRALVQVALGTPGDRISLGCSAKLSDGECESVYRSMKILTGMAREMSNLNPCERDGFTDAVHMLHHCLERKHA
jgi:hypothetical protein